MPSFGSPDTAERLVKNLQRAMDVHLGIHEEDERHVEIRIEMISTERMAE